jgi:hypothetical protein
MRGNINWEAILYISRDPDTDTENQPPGFPSIFQTV